MPVTKGQTCSYTSIRKKGSVYSAGGIRLSTDVFVCEKCARTILLGEANKHWRECVSIDKPNLGGETGWMQEGDELQT